MLLFYRLLVDQKGIILISHQRYWNVHLDNWTFLFMNFGFSSESLNVRLLPIIFNPQILIYRTSVRWMLRLKDKLHFFNKSIHFFVASCFDCGFAFLHVNRFGGSPNLFLQLARFLLFDLMNKLKLLFLFLLRLVFLFNAFFLSW